MSSASDGTRSPPDPTRIVRLVGGSSAGSDLVRLVGGSSAGSDQVAPTETGTIIRVCGVLTAKYRAAANRAGVGAEDLFNEAYLACLVALSKGAFDAAKGDLFSYLWTCAHNQVAALYLRSVSPVTIPRYLMYKAIREGAPRTAPVKNIDDADFCETDEDGIVYSDLLRLVARYTQDEQGSPRLREALVCIEPALYGWQTLDQLTSAQRREGLAALRYLINRGG